MRFATDTRHPCPTLRTPTCTTHLPRPTLYTRQINPLPGRNESDGGNKEHEVARSRRCKPPRGTISIPRGILRETHTACRWGGGRTCCYTTDGCVWIAVGF